jgi:hypothetical protein
MTFGGRKIWVSPLQTPYPNVCIILGNLLPSLTLKIGPINAYLEVLWRLNTTKGNEYAGGRRSLNVTRLAPCLKHLGRRSRSQPEVTWRSYSLACPPGSEVGRIPVLPCVNLYLPRNKQLELIFQHLGRYRPLPVIFFFYALPALTPHTPKSYTVSLAVLGNISPCSHFWIIHPQHPEKGWSCSMTLTEAHYWLVLAVWWC